MGEYFSRKQGVSLGIILTIAVLHIVNIKQHLSAPMGVLYSSYFSDVVLPFGFYFLLFISEKSWAFVKPWWVKALIVFGMATTAEILQFFGVYALGITFDPLDIVAYALGVLVAVVLDQMVFERYLAFWRA